MAKSGSSNADENAVAIGISDLGQPLAAAAESYSTWVQNSGHVQLELIRFMGERIRKDADVMKEFVTCKNPIDAVQLQMQFASKMASDYMEESQKLLSMISRATVDSVGRASRPG
jgi:hypothetical protein